MERDKHVAKNATEAAEPAAEQQDADGAFVDIGNLHLHVQVGGGGQPPIILIHGYAAGTFTWRQVFGALSQQGLVIAYDQPGFGQSSRLLPDDWDGHNPYALEAQADLVVALLDRFEIDKAILIGHSAGGTIATQTALRYPDRIDSLVLVAPAIFTEPPPPRGTVPILRRLGTGPGQVLVRALARLVDQFIDRSWHDRSKITQDVRENYRQFLRAEHWELALWYMSIAERTPRLSRRIAELSLPTLVVTGDDDRVIRTRQSIRVVRRLPNARLALIHDCGHIPQEEMPEQFLSAVFSFIESRRSSMSQRPTRDDRVM